MQSNDQPNDAPAVPLDAQLDFAAEAGGLGLWEFDLVTGELLTSPVFRRNFGHPVDAPMSRDGVQAAIHPDDIAAVNAAFDAAVADDGTYDIEFRVVRDSGTAWIHHRGATRRDVDGAPVGIAGTSLDVTARHDAELRLTVSEEALRLATDAGEVGTWDLDLTTDILTWSDRTKAMFGIAAQATCDMRDFYAGLHPDDLVATSAAFASALDPAVRATYDVEYRTIGRDDGVVRWVAAKGKALFDAAGTCVRAIGTAIDITERRAARERLRASEARLADSEGFLRLLLESTSEPFYSIDTTGVTTSCNGAFARMLGFASPDDALGRRLHEVIHHSHPDGRHYPVDDCPIYRAAATGVAAHILDEVFFRLDGSAFPVEYRAEPLFRGGVLAGAICTFKDVSATRAAAQALRDLNATLEARVADRTRERDAVWRNSRDLLLVIDTAGTIVAVNPAWTALLDWREDELVGRPFFDFIHPDDLPATRDALEVAKVEHLPIVENRYRHRDGSLRDLSWVATPEGELIYASGRHVTAEKAAAARLAETEAALRQAQKMEAVGQLTGGIAHDFNNLLQIIVGNLDLIQRGLPADATRLRRSADNAMAGSQRAVTLIQRLLTFARQQPLDTQAIDVNAVVDGISDLVGRSLGETIALERSLAADLRAAAADPNQLESAILNLAVNARDAMPDGGVLTIATANADFDAAAAAARDIRAGAYVMVAMTDAGSGMDAATSARVFEPFFTTKEVGKGTGLGLAMVYGFVRQSRGHVELTSVPGQGTTVRLYLPVVAPVVEPAAVPPPMEVAASPTGTILVVEDDAAVRAASVEILRALGYAVIEAAGGAAALAILTGASAIDLVFSDIVLPGGISGIEVARAATTVRPGIRVLLTSGYDRDAYAASGEIAGGFASESAILAKPFGYADLGARVRSLLAPEAGDGDTAASRTTAVPAC